MPSPFFLPALLLIGAASTRSEDALVTQKYTAGASLNYAFEMKLNVQGMDVLLKASPTMKVKSVEKDIATLDHEFKDIKLSIGDNEQDVKIDNLVVQKSLSGDLKKISGGIDQVSPVELYLIMHFMAPAKAVAEKEVVAFKAPAVGADIPAYSFSRVFEAKETLAGKDTFRFATTLAVTGENKLKSENKVWVTADGTIVKLVAKFKNLDIPPAGGPQEGTISLTLSSK